MRRLRTNQERQLGNFGISSAGTSILHIVMSASVLPALLDRLLDPLGVLLHVLAVHVGRLDVGWRARIGVVEQTTSVLAFVSARFLRC